MAQLSSEYRVLAAAGYLFWPVSLVLVWTNYKRDRFLRFHGYQALYFGIICTVIYFVSGILQIVPFFGWLIIKALLVIWILLVLLLMYRCWQGDFFRIPLIYDLARGVME